MHLVKLNLARNCLKYIIKAYGIKKVFIPYYSCKTLWLAAREENCAVKFYHIDESFMPVEDFNQDDYIIYINYFGLCGSNCRTLAGKYRNLIVDNTHSFYSSPIGFASFNSLRKFFNVQNGAYLYIDKLIPENISVDSLELKPVLFHQDLNMFIKNELTLNNEKQIKMLSPTVISAMDKINFETDKVQRLDLYKKYSKIFDRYNKIKLQLQGDDIPYCYPFCPNGSIDIRDLNILRLWEPIPTKLPEYSFLNNTMALPLNDCMYADKIIQTLNF